MTQILLKNSVDNMQMSVLMGLFDSWNVEVTDKKNLRIKSSRNFFQKLVVCGKIMILMETNCETKHGE